MSRKQASEWSAPELHLCMQSALHEAHSAGTAAALKHFMPCNASELTRPCLKSAFRGEEATKGCFSLYVQRASEQQRGTRCLLVWRACLYKYHVYMCVCLESKWAAEWPLVVCLADMLHGPQLCLATQIYVLQHMHDNC